jgi:hypothetical protein
MHAPVRVGFFTQRMQNPSVSFRILLKVQFRITQLSEGLGKSPGWIPKK